MQRHSTKEWRQPLPVFQKIERMDALVTSIPEHEQRADGTNERMNALVASIPEHEQWADDSTEGMGAAVVADIPEPEHQADDSNYHEWKWKKPCEEKQRWWHRTGGDEEITGRFAPGENELILRQWSAFG
jgi:hypothetical protein